jgi:hypothetical protein
MSYEAYDEVAEERRVKAISVKAKADEVKRFVARGLSTREIAAEMGLSPNWVTHLKRIAGLLGPAKVAPGETLMPCGCTAKSHLSKRYADARNKRLGWAAPSSEEVH